MNQCVINDELIRYEGTFIVVGQRQSSCKQKHKVRHHQLFFFFVFYIFVFIQTGCVTINNQR